MTNYRNSERLVKICGLNTPETIKACVEAGAAMIGLVFYEKSPRAVSPELAAELIRSLPTNVKAVGLFVDPDDDWLEQVVANVPLDMIQLHGNETPDRVGEIKSNYPLPVIKAIKVGDEADLEDVLKYRHRADVILLDAKPPSNVKEMLPGGNGLSFDWHMLAEIEIPGAWILSGGLTPDNVCEAIEITDAPVVDVSSGVEDAPGRKSAEKITEFLKQVARC